MNEKISDIIRKIDEISDNPQAMALATLDFFIDLAPAEIQEELRATVEAAAIPHWFNLETINHLTGTSSNEPFQWLINLPIVEPFKAKGEGFYNIHETPRIAIRRRLGTQQPDKAKNLSQKAINILQEDDGDQTRIEKLYHLFVAAPDTAAEQCEELRRDWLSIAPPEIEHSLSITLEELLQSNMVEGHARAEILLSVSSAKSNRGDGANSGHAIREAITIAQSINHKRLLSHSFCAYSRFCLKAGASEEAIRSAEESLVLTETEFKANPERISNLYDLGTCHSLLADVLLYHGRISAVLEHNRKALDIIEIIVEKTNAHPGRLNDLSSSHCAVGDTLLIRGEVGAALNHFRTALRIIHKLATENIKHTGWQHDLSVCHSKLGDALKARGELEDALTHFYCDLNILQRLSSADPANASWQRDLAAAHTKISDVFYAQKKAAPALSILEEALAIFQRLSKNAADNLLWQRDLSVVHAKLGSVYQMQDLFEAAEQEFRTALAIATRLTQIDTQNTDWKRELSLSYNKLGGIFIKRGALRDALGAFNQEVALIAPLVESEPLNAEWRRDLALAYQRLGYVNSLLKEYIKVDLFYGRSLRILRELAAIDSSHALAQRDMALVLKGMAVNLVLLNRHHTARRYAAEATSILHILARNHPDFLPLQLESEEAKKLHIKLNH